MTQSPIRLKELLRLALSEPIRWLNAGSDEEPVVNWVSTSFEDAKGGDLLLIDQEEFSAEFLSRAEEQGISSILILGSDPGDVDKIPTEIPVGIVESEGDIRAVQRILIHTLSDQESSYLESSHRIHMQLTKLAAEGLALEELAHAILDLSGRGVLIQDKRMNVLAGYPAFDQQTIWGDISEQLTSIDRLPEPLQDRNRAGQKSLTIQQNLSGGIARIVTPISVGEVARGYLSLIGMEGELDRFDQVIAEEGALICALAMARTKAVRETEKKLQGDLLTALLQEDLSPRDAGLWVQTMGLDQTQHHTALQFAWDSPTPPSRRRLETIVNGEVARLGAKVIINPTGSNVICFCQVSPEESRPTTALSLGRQSLARANEEYPQAQARCGIGSPAGNLNKWQESFRESGQALALACRLGESEPLYFPDLSVYRLLLLIEPHPELVQFKEEVLGSLLSYDGGEEFIATLEAYFRNNGNLTKTSEELFVHRNTLSYRMERIAEITGLDLSNPDTALAVQIALKIHRMRDKKG
ncbi:MAG: helix-turn-helix domain-containing protein [Anaerolineales bacterium]|jgi:purine catabolism regulator